MKPAGRDNGYALVAAVTAVAAFAYLAFQVLAADQGGIALASGRMQQAKLSAAADAGLSLAVHGLAAEDRGLRWSIDGGARRLEFNGVDLTVTVEDERGKAPLAGLNDGQARALFAVAGAPRDKLDALVLEFRDWQSEDTTAPSANDDILGVTPGPAGRHGPFRTVGELAALKDMDLATFNRIAPAVTTLFEENGGFEPRHATPLAKAAMSGQELASADQLANETGLDNERVAEDIAPDDRYVGRTLTVRVVARDRDGAQTHRMQIVELTGDRAHPFWVRYAE